MNKIKNKFRLINNNNKKMKFSKEEIEARCDIAEGLFSKSMIDQELYEYLINSINDFQTRSIDQSIEQKINMLAIEELISRYLRYSN
jgi:primase-polymerase (primpol)-like protein